MPTLEQVKTDPKKIARARALLKRHPGMSSKDINKTLKREFGTGIWGPVLTRLMGNKPPVKKKKRSAAKVAKNGAPKRRKRRVSTVRVQAKVPKPGKYLVMAHSHDLMESANSRAELSAIVTRWQEMGISGKEIVIWSPAKARIETKTLVRF